MASRYSPSRREPSRGGGRDRGSGRDSVPSGERGSRGAQGRDDSRCRPPPREQSRDDSRNIPPRRGERKDGREGRDYSRYSPPPRDRSGCPRQEGSNSRYRSNPRESSRRDDGGPDCSRYSPPPRDQSRRGGRVRNSRSPRSRYSPPARRSPVRRRSRTRSRGRGSGRGAEPAGKPKESKTSLTLPPPARRNDEVITEERKQASVEHEGYLYATIDFTPPNTLPPPMGAGTSREEMFKYFNMRDNAISLYDWHTLPLGWEMAPYSESLIEQVVKRHVFGSHLLVLEGGKTYETAKGRNPGSLAMLAESETRTGRQYKLYQTQTLASSYGRHFIRTKLA
eukprot:TRINITY_DN105167_c0_g1_i1.p1 TRINITY_DN105167_c0_g1~~TRINITY_DN105167_c0_g1_i1.p1  ORF type:complete len:338 (+),score=19.23 TRINITY_DN105167_c0_g1_i1:55-1068(+)